MNRHDESPEKHLQRNRNEMRRLDNMRFIASIIFALAGFAMVASILFWAQLKAGLEIVEQVLP